MTNDKRMQTSEIRSTFLNYFIENNHTHVASSSLVPGNDKTLLFTNSGMVQFKDYFLGFKNPPYDTAVTSQNCIRAGGKHNDLENVGFTTRHHTFFEMLGNFSFRSYFKEQAISYAWDLLTNHFGLKKEKLWITVHHKDKESKKIWLEKIRINENQISELGDEDNFWQMGDVGPCGYCSEIYYDYGASVEGTPPTLEGHLGSRYVEIWNLVFMQFVKNPDGSVDKLHTPAVDTGMGLERMAAVLQGKNDNYEIDLFNVIINFVKNKLNSKDDLTALKVISDHIRASAFLISENIFPGNEGRNYVLRRIIRRSLCFGYQNNIQIPFMYQLVEPLIEAMGGYHQVLIEKKQTIIEQIQLEEERFKETLLTGTNLLNKYLAKHSNLKKIQGEFMFELYDTYGFPTDILVDIAKEKGLELETQKFDELMQKQKEQSKNTSTFKVNFTLPTETNVPLTHFVGYEQNQNQASILAMVKNNKLINQLNRGENAGIILDKTVFYAESGGQIADMGCLENENFKFDVQDVQKIGDYFLHFGEVIKGEIKTNEKIEAKIDRVRRNKITKNHTATHLLHSALRNVLGKHVMQKGSMVSDDKLRFDFSHTQPLTAEQIKQINLQVNEQIQAGSVANIRQLSYQEAISEGALAFFEENYGDKVRVVKYQNQENNAVYSLELCGGTHVGDLSQINSFRITNQSAIASGIRRIEATTSAQTLKYYQNLEEFKNQVSNMLEVQQADKLLSKINSITQENQMLKSKLEAHSFEQAQKIINQAVQNKQIIHDVEFVSVEFENLNNKKMKQLGDEVKSKITNGVIVITNQVEKSFNLIVLVSQELIKTHSARNIITITLKDFNLKGGGRDDFAQSGNIPVEQKTAILDCIKNSLNH